MPMHNIVPRRRLLASSLALGGLAAAAPLRAAIPPWTPNQIMGPFYPVTKPLDQDSDLTLIKGHSDPAQGQVLHLTGRVLTGGGKPVPGARVEIWQANTHGRYSHPYDWNPAPLDPNFEGYGVEITDDQGVYRFKTVKPGSYPISETWTRPPHIHFDISGRIGRVVTQMYFPDEPLNEPDQLLKVTRRPELLFARYQAPGGDMAPDSLSAVWDITLPES